jgi:hypothetical protein
MLSNNVPFGGKKQSGFGMFRDRLDPDIQIVQGNCRSRAWISSTGRVYIDQGNSLEFRGEAGMAFVNFGPALTLIGPMAPKRAMSFILCPKSCCTHLYSLIRFGSRVVRIRTDETKE